jgi:hypothetical protein
MYKIITIFEGAFLLWVSWKGHLFFSGKTNWEGEKEIKRKEMVEKYGSIIQIMSFFALISGGGIILITIFN